MKRSFIILVLALTGIQLKAQSVTFKFGYQSKTTYTINRDMKTNMTMQAPEALAAAGGGQDIVMDMSMNTTSTITTSGRDGNNMIPIKFSSKVTNMAMTMNGQEMPSASLPTDAMSTQFYGKFSPDNKLLIDSIAGKKLDDSLRTAMTKMVEAIRNGIKFPDHALKVGDTFTQEAPLSIPMPGVGNNTIAAKMTCKLLSIANNIAAFEFTETMDMNKDGQSQTQEMKMSGLGNGTFNYDIAKQFFTTMTNNLTMTFDINLGGMDMKGKGTVSAVDKVEIAGN